MFFIINYKVKVDSPGGKLIRVKVCAGDGGEPPSCAKLGHIIAPRKASKTDMFSSRYLTKTSATAANDLDADAGYIGEDIQLLHPDPRLGDPTVP